MSEYEYTLEPLGLPPAGSDRPDSISASDAVRLFIDRALAVIPGFSIDEENASPVASIVRIVDGLPLAIELAAARVRVLPVPEIAARLGDRFRLLGGGGRTADPRQRTLRATVDWSWELLEEPDRRLWRRLAVFSGGWTVAAAEAVCGGDGLEEGEVLEGLFRLVDRSLIVRGTTPAVAAGGEPARFTMLESLRAYGAERLAEAGEAEVVAGRHTAFFLALAGGAALAGAGAAGSSSQAARANGRGRARPSWSSRRRVRRGVGSTGMVPPGWRRPPTVLDKRTTHRGG